MKYEESKIEVVEINAEDIIATSNTTDENETERD